MCKEVIVHEQSKLPKHSHMYPIDAKVEQIKAHFYNKYGYMPLAIYRFSSPLGNWQFTVAEKRPEA